MRMYLLDGVVGIRVLVPVTLNDMGKYIEDEAEKCKFLMQVCQA